MCSTKEPLYGLILKSPWQKPRAVKKVAQIENA